MKKCSFCGVKKQGCCILGNPGPLAFFVGFLGKPYYVHGVFSSSGCCSNFHSSSRVVVCWLGCGVVFGGWWWCDPGCNIVRS